MLKLILNHSAYACGWGVLAIKEEKRHFKIKKEHLIKLRKKEMI